MNVLKKSNIVVGSVLSGLLFSLPAQSYEHKGFQWSAGVGANLSRNTFFQDGEKTVLKYNRGYNFHLDAGYAWTPNITTFVSIHDIFYKSSIKGDDTPEPYWMQQAFVGPSLRYYIKGNEPGVFLQGGMGYGYFSVSDVSEFKTDRHFGDAISASIGYEVDMYWNIQLNYLLNKVESNSNIEARHKSHSLALSINFHPRQAF